MSTRLLIRGSASPFRTRRSRASDEGRRFVGSRPVRRNIPRTAALSSGGRIADGGLRGRHRRIHARVVGGNRQPVECQHAGPDDRLQVG